MRRGAVLALALGGAALVAALRPFRALVAGDSMVPTLEPGDQLLCVRGARIRSGDVVVVRPSSHGIEMVKRVTGVPGEEVPVAGGAHRLAADEYMVEGDNPARSTDGRSFGPVRRDQMMGRVLARYWPTVRLVR